MAEKKTRLSVLLDKFIYKYKNRADAEGGAVQGAQKTVLLNEKWTPHNVRDVFFTGKGLYVTPYFNTEELVMPTFISYEHAEIVENEALLSVFHKVRGVSADMINLRTVVFLVDSRKPTIKDLSENTSGAFYVKQADGTYTCQPRDVVSQSGLKDLRQKVEKSKSYKGSLDIVIVDLARGVSAFKEDATTGIADDNYFLSLLDTARKAKAKEVFDTYLAPLSVPALNMERMEDRCWEVRADKVAGHTEEFELTSEHANAKLTYLFTAGFLYNTDENLKKSVVYSVDLNAGLEKTDEHVGYKIVEADNLAPIGGKIASLYNNSGNYPADSALVDKFVKFNRKAYDALVYAISKGIKQGVEEKAEEASELKLRSIDTELETRASRVYAQMLQLCTNGGQKRGNLATFATKDAMEALMTQTFLRADTVFSKEVCELAAKAVDFKELGHAEVDALMKAMHNSMAVRTHNFELIAMSAEEKEQMKQFFAKYTYLLPLFARVINYAATTFCIMMYIQMPLLETKSSIPASWFTIRDIVMYNALYSYAKNDLSHDADTFASLGKETEKRRLLITKREKKVMQLMIEKGIIGKGTRTAGVTNELINQNIDAAINNATYLQEVDAYSELKCFTNLGTALALLTYANT